MTKIRMLEQGEDPLQMHIEPSGPGMGWLFVIGGMLLSCGICGIGAALALYLR